MCIHFIDIFCFLHLSHYQYFLSRSVFGLFDKKSVQKLVDIYSKVATNHV